MITVLSVFGTRPEIIKFIPVIKALEANPECHSVVCITGQHRQMLDQMLPLARIRADIDLQLMQPNQTLQGLTSRLMGELDRILPEVRPDRVLVQGDTASAFTTAVGAFYARLPVGHIEAGLRSGDLSAPWPEEFNRRAIGIATDMHFAPTASAAEALRREHVPEEQIFVTGNTVVDALHLFRDKARQSEEIAAYFSMLDPGKRLILVTAHRREHFDGGIEQVCHAIRELSQWEGVEVAFPVHLNPKVQGPVEQILKDCAHVHLLPPQDYLHFLYLMDRATLILSDSGGVQEEAPALKRPVLVLRDTTERPEGIKAGVTRLVGTNREVILRECKQLLSDMASYRAMQQSENLYGDGQAAARIVEAIACHHQPEGLFHAHAV